MSKMSPSIPRLWTKQLILAGAFALVAGYTDVIAYMRCGGFATIMTGNVLLLARALLDEADEVKYHDRFWSGSDMDEEQGTERYHPFFFFAIIFTFLLGVALYHLGERLWPNRGAINIGIALATIMLVVEAVVSYWPQEAKGAEYLLAGFTPMFGMLMAACTPPGRLGAPTNLVTSHLVTLATLGAKACAVRLAKSDRRKVVMASCIVLCTCLGAACGALVCSLLSHRLEGLLLPVPPCLAVLLTYHDRLAKPRSLVSKVQTHIRERRARERTETDEMSAESGDDREGTSSGQSDGVAADVATCASDGAAERAVCAGATGLGSDGGRPALAEGIARGAGADPVPGAASAARDLECGGGTAAGV